MEEQKKIMLKQLELTASIADKTGVPTKDINEVTEEYNIEFEEDHKQ